MQRLEVSGAVRPLYGSLGVKGLKISVRLTCRQYLLHLSYESSLIIFLQALQGIHLARVTNRNVCPIYYSSSHFLI
jgi:hypothetical protein